MENLLTDEFKEELGKTLLSQHYESGIIAISAFEEILKKVSVKAGKETRLTFDEFLEIVGDFKDNYSTLN